MGDSGQAGKSCQAYLSVKLGESIVGSSLFGKYPFCVNYPSVMVATNR